MSNQEDILKELNEVKDFSAVVKKYISEFSEATGGRNTVAYYSGFQTKNHPSFQYLSSINDDDRYGFMSCFYKMDFSKGLNLILHTPGGIVSAAESLISYMREKFGTNIHVFVPEMAMSSGTLLALSAKEIWMGAHSNLGPIDPQLGMLPAREVIAEFKLAGEEIRKDPNNYLLWKHILEKYPAAFVGQCQNVAELSYDIAFTALREGMFSHLSPKSAASKARAIANKLNNPKIQKAHDRHIPPKRCKDMGLNVIILEENQNIQDSLLPLHHALKLTLEHTDAIKMIVNQFGKSFIRSVGHQ
jgi:ClpP class serine protease